MKEQYHLADRLDIKYISIFNQPLIKSNRKAQRLKVIKLKKKVEALDLH